MTETQPLDAVEPRHLLARGAVIAVAAIFGLTYSLSAPLIALNLAERGLSEALIGANAAMHAVGVLAVATVLPRLAAWGGVRRTILGALAVAAGALLAFPAMPSVWLWFPLRILLGGAAEALFVLSETWINELSTESTRARAMAVYTAALSLGFALGPLILSAVGTGGATPYVLGAALTAAAMVLIAVPWVQAPAFHEPAAGGPLRYLRLAPVAMATTVLNAGIETAGLSFLALYAMGAGWPENEATRLISSMMVGAIVLQLPIGWLGDKVDRRRLLLGLAVVSGLGALLWPFVLHQPVVAYAVVFTWGGVFVGIYTIMLTMVGSRFKGGELVGVYAVMGLSWGVGALAGPAIAGVAMDLVPHGLPLFAAASCLIFAVFLRRARGDT